MGTPARILDGRPVIASPRPPLRVAYLVTRFPTVTETFVLDEICALRAAGVEVTLFPLLHGYASVLQPQVQEVEPWVRYVPPYGMAVLRANLTQLGASPAAYRRALGAAFACTYPVPRFLLGALAFLPKAVALAREFERTRIGHVHSHFALHATVAALVAARLAGIPFSFTAHGSDIHVDTSGLDRKVDASAFAVTVSRYNAEFMARRLPPTLAAKIRVVHCGVDIDYFAPPAVKPRGRAEVVLVCVGSFRPVKGHEVLVDACARLARRATRFACHLIGEGPLAEAVKGRVEALGLAESFVFHGPRTRDEVRAILQDADVAVCPSVRTPQGHREGIPVALMEAMACGLPVIASRLSGIPELVIDGETGILIEPGDSGALAEALALLARDPQRRERLGQAGRQRVTEAFDVRTSARALAALFREAATDPAPAPPIVPEAT